MASNKKQVKRKTKAKRVNAYYSVICTYFFHWPTNLDAKLEKLVGRGCTGSGTSMLTGLRDVSWSWNSAESAVKAFLKLKSVRGIESLSLEKVGNRDW